MYLPVGNTVKVEVDAVVDVEEDIADCRDDSEGGVTWPSSIREPSEAGDDIEDSLWGGEESKTKQSTHQQQTVKCEYSKMNETKILYYCWNPHMNFKNISWPFN